MFWRFIILSQKAFIYCYSCYRGHNLVVAVLVEPFSDLDVAVQKMGRCQSNIGVHVQPVRLLRLDACSGSGVSQDADLQWHRADGQVSLYHADKVDTLSHGS